MYKWNIIYIFEPHLYYNRDLFLTEIATRNFSTLSGVTSLPACHQNGPYDSDE